MHLNKQKASDKKNTDKLLCYERIRNNIYMKLTKNLNSEVYHMDGEFEELECIIRIVVLLIVCLEITIRNKNLFEVLQGVPVFLQFVYLL